MRILWFWIAFTASCAVGYFGYESLPSIIDFFTTGILSSSYLYLLKSNTLLVVAAQVSLAVVAFTFLGLALPAAFDAIVAAQAKGQLATFPASTRGIKPRTLLSEFTGLMNTFPGLREPAGAYTPFLKEEMVPPETEKSSIKVRQKPPTRLRACAAAEDFFTPALLVEENLIAWLFKRLPGMLPGVGFILLVISLIIGVHNYRESLPLDPVGSSAVLWTWIETGIFALAITAVGGFVSALITRLTIGFRHAQCARFCRFLNVHFGYTPQTAVLQTILEDNAQQAETLKQGFNRVSSDITAGLDESGKSLVQALQKSADKIASQISKSIDQSLHTPLDKITEATKKLTEEQASQMKQLVKSALTAFVKDLEKHVGDQARETNSILKSTSTLAGKVEKSFTDATKNLVKQGKDQGDAVAHVSKEMTKALASIKSLEQALEKAVSGVQPSLDKAIENQTSLIAALNDEKAASKTIGQAATEMNRAAKASKDTVESFITLAERLKEAGKALNTGPGQSLAPVGRDESKKMGRAVRDLQDRIRTTRDLPEL